jgi:uncharacterized Zn finger protein (UPF0148 family)
MGLKPITRKCLHCKLRFEPKYNGDTVCSRVCGNAYKLAKQQAKENKVKRQLYLKPIPKVSKNGKIRNEKKIEYYKSMWLLSANKRGECTCENCGMILFEFKPHYISHILSRGAHPKLALHPLNHNILCCGLGTNECHEQWEFGDRTSMLIYEKNNKRIEKLMGIENAR